MDKEMNTKIAPMNLAVKTDSAKVCKEYDWRKQSLKYDTCKAGTMFQTGSVKFGPGHSSPEHWHQD